ncbi:MAG: hypothetical protein WAK03_13675 [Methylocystis sp.]|jgi:hypothetical protein
MQRLTQTDIALVKTVNAHLKQLSVLSSAHNADEADIRVASSSLRFLLVEESLAWAWRASGLGGSMTFKTWCIISTEGNDVIAYCGGGDVLPGMPFSACRNAKLAELSLNLHDFCKRTRIQIGKEKISTVQLIQYVANTLGGAHFDPEGKSPKSRKPAFDLLRRLEAGEFGGLPLLVNDRNLLHHELFSVAQALVRSPDVARLKTWGVTTT